jgi:hypothetical protein
VIGQYTYTHAYACVSIVQAVYTYIMGEWVGQQLSSPDTHPGLHPDTIVRIVGVNHPHVGGRSVTSLGC